MKKTLIILLGIFFFVGTHEAVLANVLIKKEGSDLVVYNSTDKNKETERYKDILDDSVDHWRIDYLNSSELLKGGISEYTVSEYVENSFRKIHFWKFPLMVTYEKVNLKYSTNAVGKITQSTSAPYLSVENNLAIEFLWRILPMLCIPLASFYYLVTKRRPRNANLLGYYFSVIVTVLGGIFIGNAYNEAPWSLGCIIFALLIGVIIFCLRIDIASLIVNELNFLFISLLMAICGWENSALNNYLAVTVIICTLSFLFVGNIISSDKEQEEKEWRMKIDSNIDR